MVTLRWGLVYYRNDENGKPFLVRGYDGKGAYEVSCLEAGSNTSEYYGKRIKIFDRYNNRDEARSKGIAMLMIQADKDGYKYLEKCRVRLMERKATKNEIEYLSYDNTEGSDGGW